MAATIVILKNEFKGKEVKHYVLPEFMENKKCPLYGIESVMLEYADQEVLSFLYDKMDLKKFLKRIPDNSKNEDKE